MKKIVLASASRRRHDLLKKAGIPFEVVVSHFEEDMEESVSPDELVKGLSEKKALVVKRLVKQPCIIIAADTIVSLNGSILGKPKDGADAARILKMLQGKKHTVFTGVTIIDKTKHDQDNKQTQIVAATDVYMRKLTDDEIYAYIKTGEPFDKAGAYAIQEKGSLLVEKIDGDYYTVVGLPLVQVYAALKDFGFDLMDNWD